MIPSFTPSGILPVGIHTATMKEFTDRFAYTPVRQQLLEGLIKLMNDLRNIDCKVIYVDGSYVTNKRIPKDIDVCWDHNSVNLKTAMLSMPVLWDLNPPRKAQHDLYNCDIFPAFVNEGISGVFFIDFFQKVKYTNEPKGIVKLNI